MEGLESQAQLSAVLEKLAQLAESPCLAIGGGSKFSEQGSWVRRKPNSARSLKHFWEHGGKAWLEAYLDLADQSEHGLVLYAEPSVRSVLSRESTPEHRLAPLLCSENDTSCVEQSSAFRKRAVRRFELEFERRRLAAWQDTARETADATSPASFDECSERVLSTDGANKLDGWIDCLEEHATRRLDFPLIGVDVPTRGWLVLSGRRGHYRFCDEHRAYHLGSGSSFVVGSCSGLVLGDDGGADHRRADARRGLQRRVGTIPPLALREAVWFLLMAPELEEVVQPDGYVLPAEVPRVSQDQWQRHGGSGFARCVSSGDTRIAWSYVLDGRSLATGELIWPGCGWDWLENNYAVELIDLAELQLVEGCPSVAPPRHLVTAQRLKAHALDSDRHSLRRAATELRHAWSKLLASPCAGVRPGR